MEGYTVQQRVNVVRCYYQNQCSIRLTLRALRDDFFRHMRLTESTNRRLIERFESSG